MDRRAGIDEELTAFRCLHDALQTSSIDLLDHDLGILSEKVVRTDRITVATRHVMALASE
jgi:hypothetical protein